MWQRIISNWIANKLHDLDGHNWIARVLKAEEAGRRGGQRRNVTMSPSHRMGDKLDPSLLVLKTEKRPQAKEVRAPLGCGKDQEPVPSELRDGTEPCRHLHFCPKTLSGFQPHKC